MKHSIKWKSRSLCITVSFKSDTAACQNAYVQKLYSFQLLISKLQSNLSSEFPWVGEKWPEILQLTKSKTVSQFVGSYY